MPRYDYRCGECGHVQEQTFASLEMANLYDFDLTCHRCGEEAMTRLPASPNFAIKGYSAKNGYSRKKGETK